MDESEAGWRRWQDRKEFRSHDSAGMVVVGLATTFRWERVPRCIHYLNLPIHSSPSEQAKRMEERGPRKKKWRKTSDSPSSACRVM